MNDHDTIINHGHRLQRAEEDVKDLQHVVYGNGTPGLKTDVDRLKQRGLRTKEAWGLWIGMVSAVIAALGVLASWVK